MKPMLAANAVLDKIQYPVCCSPKLDGVRAIVKDGMVLSRALKPIPNKIVQQKFKHLEGFDGELIAGSAKDPKSFSKTTTGVMSIEGDFDVTFNIFDNFSEPSLPFFKRYEKVLSLYKEPYCSVVPHILIGDEESLRKFELDMISMGYEGVMIRDRESPYKFGRSTVNEGYLLKLKRFSDGEATIVGFEELIKEDGSKGDTLGALVVKSIDGSKIIKVFKIGTGFTNEERDKIWFNKPQNINKIVKYKYFEHGTYAAPRHPVFIGFRDEGDL